MHTPRQFLFVIGVPAAATPGGVHADGTAVPCTSPVRWPR